MTITESQMNTANHARQWEQKMKPVSIKQFLTDKLSTNHLYMTFHIICTMQLGLVQQFLCFLCTFCISIPVNSWLNSLVRLPIW